MTNHGPEPNPKPSNDETEPQGANGLPALLRFVAIFSVIGGFVAACSLSETWNGWRHVTDYAVAALWVVGGIVSALTWWSLSYIVEAAQKYIDKN